MKVQVLSIALLGYEMLYAKLLDTHKCYAQKHGYEYLSIIEHQDCNTQEDAAWLKITEILKRLQQGLKVLFLDADIRVSPHTPCIESVEVAGKLLYMARGHSGRFNSGMIYALPNEETIAFFIEILKDRGNVLSSADKMIWENGYVIKHSRDKAFVLELDSKWNNTKDPFLQDYFRHYTGPMKKYYKQ